MREKLMPKVVIVPACMHRIKETCPHMSKRYTITMYLNFVQLCACMGYIQIT